MLGVTKSAAWMLYDAKQQAHDWLRSFTFECVRLIANSADRTRQRRALADLNDRMLSDIGITRDQARRESAMPFWR